MRDDVVDQQVCFIHPILTDQAESYGEDPADLATYFSLAPQAPAADTVAFQLLNPITEEQHAALVQKCFFLLLFF